MRTELRRAVDRARFGLAYDMQGGDALLVLIEELQAAYAALPSAVALDALLGDATLADRIRVVEVDLANYRLRVEALEAQVAGQQPAAAEATLARARAWVRSSSGSVVGDEVVEAFYSHLDEQGVDARWELATADAREGIARAVTKLLKPVPSDTALADDCPVGYTPHRRGSDPDGCVVCRESSVPSGTMPGVDAPPAAAPRRDGHVPVAHPPGHHDRDQSAATCMFCEGGLFACERCHSFEGATTDMCPGVKMTGDQSGEVYAGRLNYRRGGWRPECPLIRMDHDTRNPGVSEALSLRRAELEEEAAERAAGREVPGG